MWFFSVKLVPMLGCMVVFFFKFKEAILLLISLFHLSFYFQRMRMNQWTFIAYSLHIWFTWFTKSSIFTMYMYYIFLITLIVHTIFLSPYLSKYDLIEQRLDSMMYQYTVVSWLKTSIYCRIKTSDINPWCLWIEGSIR